MSGPADNAEAPVARPSWRDAMRARLYHMWRPFRRSSRTSRALIFIGLGVVAFFALLALVGPTLYGFEATQYRVEVSAGEFEPISQLAPPSVTHPMGTTRDGFDVLARFDFLRYISMWRVYVLGVRP